MPLRVEVNKGGVNSSGNEDTYYYGSLYVPFDTRLGNTTDAAFTLTGSVTDGSLEAPGTTTMASVSQLNEMGNPQFVPANWPVVIRTNNGNNSVTLKNQKVGDEEATTYATRHYVNLNLPNVTPTVISNVIDGETPAIKLSGEYLEQTISTDKQVLVFGLPFEGPTAVGHSSHKYDDTKRVGFFTNDNWARENHPELKAHADSYPSTASVATDAVTDEKKERDNKYVYHNKVYYLHPVTNSSRYSIAIFDDEETPEDQPIQDTTTKKNVPWPCRVYDLQGRLIAEKETPQTLLKNYPSLQPGIYIFGERKVVVK